MPPARVPATSSASRPAAALKHPPCPRGLPCLTCVRAVTFAGRQAQSPQMELNMVQNLLWLWRLLAAPASHDGADMAGAAGAVPEPQHWICRVREGRLWEGEECCGHLHRVDRPLARDVAAVPRREEIHAAEETARLRQ